VRAGRSVRRVSARAIPGREEPLILATPWRDAAITAVIAALTAALFALAANRTALSHIQRLDSSWLRLMVSGRDTPVTVVAKVFNILGLVYVTLPVRLAVAGYLAFRRRWWHLAAFAAAVLLSEVLIGPLKATYGRARPPGSLVATSGASFPSGHSIAASVTVFAMVIALVPAGRRRMTWGLTATVFALLMALSRAYLGAHWLSDAIAGLLLGTSCALLGAIAVDQAQRRRRRQDGIRGAPLQEAVRPADQRRAGADRQ
jgi:membrane-associated phospholipid phosphatase